MGALKNYLAGFWGAAAFYLLCYGIALRSANALLLFASISPLLAVFLWWTIDRAALEQRIKRLEARSEIANERRLVTQADLAEIERKLEDVLLRVDFSENLKTHMETH
jgi:hypothetical protein